MSILTSRKIGTILVKKVYSFHRVGATFTALDCYLIRSQQNILYSVNINTYKICKINIIESVFSLGKFGRLYHLLTQNCTRLTIKTSHI